MQVHCEVREGRLSPPRRRRGLHVGHGRGLDGLVWEVLRHTPKLGRRAAEEGDNSAPGTSQDPWSAWGEGAEPTSPLVISPFQSVLENHTSILCPL